MNPPNKHGYHWVIAPVKTLVGGIVEGGSEGWTRWGLGN